jgi:tight adherence protein C
MNTQADGLSVILYQSVEIRWLLVALLSAGIYFGILVSIFIFSRYVDPVRRQLDTLSSVDARNLPLTVRPAKQFAWLSDLILPRNPIRRDKIVNRLAHAGYRSPNRLMIFYLARLSLMILLPLLTLMAAPFISWLTASQILLLALIALVVGMLGPSYYLDKKVASRQRILRHALPDAIDLLVVCTEAGMGLNNAIQRVAQALVDIHPDLAMELLMVNTQIRAGVERTQALTNLAERTGLDDIKGLTAIIAQTMRFGTSIAHTLRDYSEEFRDRRMQKADEEAAKLATKMIFPLVFCFMPGFFIVAVGPSIVSIINAWRTMGQ